MPIPISFPVDSSREYRLPERLPCSQRFYFLTSRPRRLTGEVLRVIRQLADEHMTMVIVTHEMQFAKELSDRVIFMEKGLVCQEGTPEEVFGNPNARVKEFIGRVMQV